MSNSGEKKIRGMYDILAAILQICQQRTKRTHVIYKANLSFSALQEYIQLALRAGLIEETENRDLLTTMKGRLFLQEYRKIERLLEAEGKKEEEEDELPMTGQLGRR